MNDKNVVTFCAILSECSRIAPAIYDNCWRKKDLDDLEELYREVHELRKEVLSAHRELWAS